MSRTCTVGHAAAGVLAFLVSSNLLLAQAAPSQNAAAGLPTYRVQANEVQLTFSATDQNDRVLATLNAADFAVVDKDLIVRSFRSFRRAEYIRLDVAILLDNSNSIAARFQQEIAQTLNLLSETSGVPEESISIVSFRGTEPVLVCKGDCRTRPVPTLVPAKAVSQMTPLYDSLAFTAELLAQPADQSAPDPKVRRVVIVLSDGEDTISRNSAGQAVADLVANDVQVYTLDANKSEYSRGSVFLQKLAAATGGRSFHLGDRAGSVADAVLADFHASYQVTYRVPNSSAGFHSVRILPTHNLNLNFRCRQGYVDPSGR